MAYGKDDIKILGYRLHICKWSEIWGILVAADDNNTENALNLHDVIVENTE